MDFKYTLMSMDLPSSSIGFSVQEKIKELAGKGIIPEILLHDIAWSKNTVAYFNPEEECDLYRMNGAFYHRDEYPELYAWILTHPRQVRGEKWNWRDSFGFSYFFANDMMPWAYDYAYGAESGSYLFTRYLDGSFDTYHQLP